VKRAKVGFDLFIKGADMPCSSIHRDVTTAFRQHPGEMVWRLLWQLAAIALFGVPLWLLFVTPHMHKVHHSRDQKETDSNYSNIFSLWDKIFGTYTSATDFRQLSYGLDGFDVEERQTLGGLLKMPFMNYNRV